MSKEKRSAYSELVLDRSKESGVWIARIYNRYGPATMLAESSGEEDDYETARVVAREWADIKLDEICGPVETDDDREFVTVGEDGVGDVTGTLNLG